MTERNMKFFFECSKCKSTDILADAWAEWNIETQSWELQNVFEYSGGHCNACDGPTRLEERKCDG